jgi:hypothetical protein
VSDAGVPALDAACCFRLNLGVGISLPPGEPAEDSNRPKPDGAGVWPAFVVLGPGVPLAAAAAAAGAGVSAELLSAHVTDLRPVLPPVVGAADLSLLPAAAAPTGVPNMVSGTGVLTSRCRLSWASASNTLRSSIQGPVSNPTVGLQPPTFFA